MMPNINLLHHIEFNYGFYDISGSRTCAGDLTEVDGQVFAAFNHQNQA